MTVSMRTVKMRFFFAIMKRSMSLFSFALFIARLLQIASILIKGMYWKNGAYLETFCQRCCCGSAILLV